MSAANSDLLLAPVRMSLASSTSACFCSASKLQGLTAHDFLLLSHLVQVRLACFSFSIITGKEGILCWTLLCHRRRIRAPQGIQCVARPHYHVEPDVCFVFYMAQQSRLSKFSYRSSSCRRCSLCNGITRRREPLNRYCRRASKCRHCPSGVDAADPSPDLLPRDHRWTFTGMPSDVRRYPYTCCSCFVCLPSSHRVHLCDPVKLSANHAGFTLCASPLPGPLALKLCGCLHDSVYLLSVLPNIYHPDALTYDHRCVSLYSHRFRDKVTKDVKLIFK